MWFLASICKLGLRNWLLGLSFVLPNLSSQILTITCFFNYSTYLQPRRLLMQQLYEVLPKVDKEPDSKGGIQKFRIELLAECNGQSTMDVHCQVWSEAGA
ncbi:hypothetical protein AgCh_017300 [Apium graveolens]